MKQLFGILITFSMLGCCSCPENYIEYERELFMICLPISPDYVTKTEWGTQTSFLFKNGSYVYVGLGKWGDKYLGMTFDTLYYESYPFVTTDSNINAGSLSNDLNADSNLVKSPNNQIIFTPPALILKSEDSETRITMVKTDDIKGLDLHGNYSFEYSYEHVYHHYDSVTKTLSKQIVYKRCDDLEYGIVGFYCKDVADSSFFDSIIRMVKWKYSK